MTKTKTDPNALLSELNRRRESDARAYARLVKAVASGEDVSPSEAESTLKAAGKTVENLSDAVAAIQQRRGEDLELARIPELDAALVAAREATAAKRQEVAKVVEALNGEIQVLAYREGQAERQLAAAKMREGQILAERARQERAEDEAVHERLFGHIDPEFRPPLHQ